MFDFRYHALSLVAVFLALAVGVLLGVAIGDRGLVSGAEQDIRASLRADVRREQSRSSALRDELARRGRYERTTYPALVADRLRGRRIAVLELGGTPDRTLAFVREALAPSGALITGVGVLRTPFDAERVTEGLRGTRLEGLGTDPAALERLGRRLGRGLTGSAALLARLRPALLESSSGELARVDAVVVVRGDLRGSRAEADAFDSLARGLVAGLTSAGAKVVGAETTRADPSQVGWYKDRGVSSVDSVDGLPGRAALVFALAARPQTVGAFGIKPGADSQLPTGEGLEPPP